MVYIQPGNRIMDKAYMRDGKIVHTGEAMALAVLLHAKGRTNRGIEEVKQIGIMLDDPNIDVKKRKTRRK